MNRFSISPTSRSQTPFILCTTPTMFHDSRSTDKHTTPLDQSKDINSDRIRTVVSKINEASPLEKISVIQKKEETAMKQSVGENIVPRPIKMYQLLSTQSEDRGEGELQLDRRIFQISKQDDTTAVISSTKHPLNKSSSVFTLKSSASGDIQTLTCGETADDSNVRKAISPGEVGTSQSFLGDASSVSVRPIYPYCPYSPYGSPQGSPRNRRRPLRESRRVSIDNKQGALQLNQYKLLDNIGQVSLNCSLLMSSNTYS